MSLVSRPQTPESFVIGTFNYWEFVISLIFVFKTFPSGRVWWGIWNPSTRGVCGIGFQVSSQPGDMKKKKEKKGGKKREEEGRGDQTHGGLLLVFFLKLFSVTH